jgi:hypothetical protein
MIGLPWVFGHHREQLQPKQCKGIGFGFHAHLWGLGSASTGERSQLLVPLDQEQCKKVLLRRIMHLTSSTNANEYACTVSRTDQYFH